MCRSTDPRDKRTRVGALVETDGGTDILIDTPPELRLQLIAAERESASTRSSSRTTTPITSTASTTSAPSPTEAICRSRCTGRPRRWQRLAKRFAYIFDDSIKALPGTSKPEGRAHAVLPGKSFRVGDVDVLPVAVPHGPVSVYGYRIGNLGYITDAKDASRRGDCARFAGVSVLVLNALFRSPHPTHLSISEAVDAARKVGARQTWLTHLTHRRPVTPSWSASCRAVSLLHSTDSTVQVA